MARLIMVILMSCSRRSYAGCEDATASPDEDLLFHEYDYSGTPLTTLADNYKAD